MNTLINFELSKLLKEKGFSYGFGEGQKFYFPETKELTENHRGNNYPAPTIAEVVMWLYEKHDVWISPIPDSSSGHRLIMRKMSVHLFKYKNGLNVQTETLRNIDKDIIYFLSPTEAYEAAIEYTLNNLI